VITHPSIEDEPAGASPMVKAVLAAAVGCTLMVAGQGLADATPGGPGAAPPLPAIGQYSHAHSRPLSGRDLQFSQQKTAKARAHWTKVQQRLSTAGTGDALMTATTYRDLAVGYQPQVNEVYCGPATTAMIAHFIGVGWAGTNSQQQQSAASLLGTTNNGTAWYGADNVPSFPYGSWYPVADSLDYRIYKSTGNTWYDAQPVAGSPSSSESTTYKQNLTFDVDYDYPMALNQYSIPGYQFYYQPNQSWQHWLVSRGYSGTGSSTIVNDPGWSAGNNATVPSVSVPGSVLEAVGGRGYIW
jgi:hypothetical protein